MEMYIITINKPLFKECVNVGEHMELLQNFKWFCLKSDRSTCAHVGYLVTIQIIVLIQCVWCQWLFNTYLIDIVYDIRTKPRSFQFVLCGLILTHLKKEF